jgi:hypothetical protein
MNYVVSPEQVDHARALLRKIRVARDAGKRKRVDYLGRQYLNSFDAKLTAVRKAYQKIKPYRRPDESELQAIAHCLDPWKGTKEEVRVIYKPKASNPGKYRVIMNFGIENRALQYLALRLLEKVVEPHPRQYLMRGGVKAAIYQLARAMANGPVCAYELDIENCFPSFDGKKLPGLIPLPKEVTTHVIISEYLYLKGGTTTIYDPFGPADDDEWACKGLLDDALADARRGIPQGSAVSNIVAEIVLALSLNAVPPLGMVFAYADNVLLLAATESNAVAMKKALWSALEAHPVGRLRPKAKLFGIGEPIDFLGHRLSRVNGKVRIAPTPRNQENFEAHVVDSLVLLRQKLPAKERAEVIRELNEYVRSWTDAHSLCDGIEQIRAGLIR